MLLVKVAVILGATSMAKTKLSIDDIAAIVVGHLRGMHHYSGHAVY